MCSLTSFACGNMHDFSVELLRVNHKPDALNARRVVVILASVLLIASLLPIPYRASPRWDVWVVKDDGKPRSGISVRLVYQNYSAENQSHEVTLRTNENGHVLFPAQYGRASLLQRLLYSVSSAGTGIHASFGRHAGVFAFGNGYEGTAATGQYVTDWQGTPESMESRIVFRKTGS
jgi:hypothetical protein